jgi:predicted nucleic acid-binding protein
MEIVAGFQKARSTTKLQRFLSTIASEVILPFDQAAAELAGRIAGDLARAGQPIGRADPMIAAIALTHGLELATGNTSHYQRVQNLGYQLTIIDWR